jgi:biotin carboxyl carrier protein
LEENGKNGIAAIVNMRYNIGIADKTYRLDLEKAAEQDRWLCRLDGREITVDATAIDANTISVVIDGRSFEIRREKAGDTQRILLQGSPYDVTLQDQRSLKSRKRAGARASGTLRVTATMPGKVVRVLAKEGDSLEAGSGIVVVEAMKMQNEIRSPREGMLKQLLAREGMNVNAGDVLAVLE